MFQPYVKEVHMLGLGDFWVSFIFILTILSAALCVVYGIRNWNKEGAISEQEVREEIEWDRKEKEIENNL